MRIDRLTSKLQLALSDAQSLAVVHKSLDSFREPAKQGHLPVQLVVVRIETICAHHV